MHQTLPSYEQIGLRQQEILPTDLIISPAHINSLPNIPPFLTDRKIRMLFQVYLKKGSWISPNLEPLTDAFLLSIVPIILFISKSTSLQEERMCFDKSEPNGSENKNTYASLDEQVVITIPINQESRARNLDPWGLAPTLDYNFFNKSVKGEYSLTEEEDWKVGAKNLTLIESLYSTLCVSCAGKGSKPCRSCLSSGHTPCPCLDGTKEPCTRCSNGKKKCSNCNGLGRNQCSSCSANGSIQHYIIFSISREIKTSEKYQAKILVGGGEGGRFETTQLSNLFSSGVLNGLKENFILKYRLDMGEKLPRIFSGGGEVIDVWDVVIDLKVLSEEHHSFRNMKMIKQLLTISQCKVYRAEFIYEDKKFWVYLFGESLDELVIFHSVDYPNSILDRFGKSLKSLFGSSQQNQTEN